MSRRLPPHALPSAAQVAVLEAHAALEAELGRPPTTSQLVARCGVGRGAVGRARALLVAAGYLARSPGRGGGVYRADRARLAEARAIVPRAKCTRVPDAEITSAAAALVADRRYPGCRAVAALAGCSERCVHARRPRLEALGLWPDWRAAGLSPHDGSARHITRLNFRRRMRLAGGRPDGPRSVRPPTVYREVR